MPTPWSRATADPDRWRRLASWGLVAVAWAASLVAVVTLSPLQLAGIGFAVAASLGLLLRPKAGLLLLIGLRVFVDLLWFLSFSVMGMRLTELYAGVGAVALAVILLLRVSDVARHPAILPAVAFVALLAIGALRVGPGGAPLLVKLASPALVLLATSTYLNDRRDPWRYLWLFGLAGVVPLARSAWSIWHGTDYALLAGAHRLIAGYQNATNHALVVALLAQIGVLGLLSVRRRGLRIAWGVYTAVALVAVRESYNRSSVVALAVFLVVLLSMQRRWRLLAITTPVALTFLVFNDVMQDRFLEIFTTSASYGSSTEDAGSGRWGLWTSSLRYWTDRPVYELLLGMGLGRHFIGYGTMDPHNDYLAVTYQAGPLATIAVATLLARGAWLSYRAGQAATDPGDRLLAHFCSAATIAAMLTSFLTNGYIVRSSAAWYLFAITGLGYAVHARVVAAPAEALPPSPATPPTTPRRSAPGPAAAPRPSRRSRRPDRGR